jgi:hypothetical protein
VKCWCSPNLFSQLARVEAEEDDTIASKLFLVLFVGSVVHGEEYLASHLRSFDEGGMRGKERVSDYAMVCASAAGWRCRKMNTCIDWSRLGYETIFTPLASFIWFLSSMSPWFRGDRQKVGFSYFPELQVVDRLRIAKLQKDCI